jgi:hypothetical protein
MRIPAGRRALGLGLGLCIAVALVLVRPADAQILGRDSDRPSRGLFGPDNRPKSQSLTFGASVGLGRARTTFDVPTTDPAIASDSSWSKFNAGSGDLTYVLDRQRFGVNSSLAVSGRRAEDGTTRSATSGTVETLFNVPFSRRTSLSGEMSAGYRPVSVMTVFPSVFETDPSGLPLDYQLTGKVDHYATGLAKLSMTHALSRRSSVYALSETTHAWASSTRAGQQTFAGGAGYDYSWGKGVSVRLGYVTRIGDYSRLGTDGKTRSRTDTIDAGINYGRAISITRRTKLTLGSGTTAISDGRSKRYDITGNANLTYEVGRSWGASLIYDRRAGFIETLAAPSFYDDVSGTFGGLFTRRLSMQLQGGAARGTVGVTTPNNYWIYRGALGVGFALSRALSLQFDYLNYRYRFDDGQFLPLTTNPRATRQTAQVTLQLWAPIFQRSRKPNATR